MRKILLSVLSFMCVFNLIFSLSSISADAAENTDTLTSYEHLPDGSFIVTCTSIDSTARSSGTITAHRTKYYKDASGNNLWSVTVTGTFTYNGSSSQCTNSSVNAQSYNSDWKIYSTNASRSGNTATATGTAQTYYKNTVINTYSLSVSLTCDKNGNLS
ncbi:MAG: hypothetical protein MR355_02835 [Lachnospiraceae bacterium]|nr:hypothetical protein [Lachnospiraceae bacterium]